MIQITNTFKIHDVFVYEGLCDNINTKWITKKEWNKEINIQFNGTELIYTDRYGNEIIVLEKDDPDWNKYIEKKIL